MNMNENIAVMKTMVIDLNFIIFSQKKTGSSSLDPGISLFYPQDRLLPRVLGGDDV